MKCLLLLIMLMISAVEIEADLPSRDEMSKRPRQNALCPKAPQRPGEFIENHKSLREFLGPHLKRVVVIWVEGFETHTLGGLGVDSVRDALAKRPRSLYRYPPWANAVSPEFVARLEYDNGSQGVFEMAYGYASFQDQHGTLWWARFASASDVWPQGVS